MAPGLRRQWGGWETEREAAAGEMGAGRRGGLYIRGASLQQSLVHGAGVSLGLCEVR